MREVVPSSSVAVETAGGVGWLETVVGDVWDPVFEGAYIPAEEMSLDNPIVQKVAERWADDPFALFHGEGGFL